MLERTTVPRASRIPLDLTGQWNAPRDWRGRACSIEPLVAIVFLRANEEVAWGLSRRSDQVCVPIRLVLSPYDQEGRDVQIAASVSEEGQRCRSHVPTATYRPTMPATSRLTTGEVTIVARIDSEPAIDFLALFLAKSDIQSGRNGIWHLRPELCENLPDVLKTPLTKGRTGYLVDT